MPDQPSHTRPDLDEQVAQKEARRLRARRRKDGGLWFGLGAFGMVGWSIAIPTIAGIAIGVWIDSSFPSQISWTLTLLVAGLAIGCLSAWRWVNAERSSIESEQQAGQPTNGTPQDSSDNKRLSSKAPRKEEDKGGQG